MRDLGNCPLIRLELLFGSRHLDNVRLMSPATRPAANGALRGAVVRGSPKLGFGLLDFRSPDRQLGTHPFHHFGQPSLGVSKPGFNGHQLRRFLLAPLDGADIPGNVVDTVGGVLQRLQECCELGLGGDHPKIVAHFEALSCAIGWRSVRIGFVIDLVDLVDLVDLADLVGDVLDDLLSSAQWSSRGRRLLVGRPLACG
jgi:hypothetical protein